MSIHLRVFTATVIVLLSSTAVVSQTLTYEEVVKLAKSCNDPLGDIESCTLIIERGGYSRSILAPVFHNRATKRQRQGLLELAADDWTNAISITPMNLYYDMRGRMFLELSSPSKALADFDSSIALDANRANAHVLRGDALYALGQYDDALTAYNRAISVDRRAASALLSRGNFYYSRRQFNEARSDYDRSLKVSDADYISYLVATLSWDVKTQEHELRQFRAATYEAKGNTYLAQGSFEQAVKEYDTSLKIVPTASAQFWRAQAYSKLGNRAETYASYGEFIALEFAPASFPVIESDDATSKYELGNAVQFARPPLPSEAELKTCLARQSNNQDEFFGCVVGEALPKDYRIANECIAQNKNDSGRAYVCTTDRKDLLKAYDDFQAIRQCADKAKDNTDLALCAGKQFVGKDEQYYIGCIANNRGDYKAAAVCAVTKGLNPEQQIALSCAISTGGQPYAFAVCTGGQLLQRELEKCWKNGMATKDGCFGPNNEYVKFINQFDSAAKNVLGQNSEAYKAWKLWKDNVLAPGPNHEAIKAFNTALKDMQNGPGPNNDLVKLTRNPVGAIKAAGKKIKIKVKL